MSDLYCTVPLLLPAEELAETLHRNLATISSKIQMFKLLEENRKQPSLFGELRKPVLKMTFHSLFHHSFVHSPFSLLDETESCYYGGLADKHFGAEQLERETRGQSLNKTRHQVFKSEGF